MRIQGGSWTKAHKGVVADSATAYARVHTKAFCTRFNWPKQRGFTFNLYGQEESVHLATEWANRGNHFARLWFEGGCILDCVFDCEGEHAYPEPFDFIDWACSVEVDSPVWPKVTEVRAAVPH